MLCNRYLTFPILSNQLHNLLLVLGGITNPANFVAVSDKNIPLNIFCYVAFMNLEISKTADTVLSAVFNLS
jgi:hypothetical protein